MGGEVECNPMIEFTIPSFAHLAEVNADPLAWCELP